MSDNPYQVLGVAPDASDDDIRAAYRKLAKELHPDVNPGDRTAEDRFKQVSAAYDILGDSEKKAKFDRGEIDASGHETQREFYRQYADGDAGGAYHSSAGFEDLGDLFTDFFNARGGSGDQRAYNIRMRGADLRYNLPIEFLDAINGATRRVTMPDGRTLDVTIPKGLRDGQVLRLKGQGRPGMGGGDAGDAFVEIDVRTHSLFTRENNNIRLVLPVSLPEAVLGAKVEVPTTSGRVNLTIPKGSSGGTVLRLKDKGVPHPDGRPAGDQLVELRLMLPDQPEPELEAFMTEWQETHAYDVRAELEA